MYMLHFKVLPKIL